MYNQSNVPHRELKDSLTKSTRGQTINTDGTKYCTKCDKNHSLEEFSKDRTKSSGYNSFCKSSVREYRKKYYNDNREELIRKSVERSRGCEKSKARKLRYSRSEKGKAVMKEYQKLNRHKYYPKTAEQKLKALWRKKMSKVKNRTSFSFKTFDFLGYKATDLKKRLEMNFKPGMSWDNHGEWHIDHKKPLSYFDYSSPKEIKKSWLLCNLQPLWAKDNLTKNNKFIG